MWFYKQSFMFFFHRIVSAKLKRFEVEYFYLFFFYVFFNFISNKSFLIIKFFINYFDCQGSIDSFNLYKMFKWKYILILKCVNSGLILEKKVTEVYINLLL